MKKVYIVITVIVAAFTAGGVFSLPAEAGQGREAGDRDGRLLGEIIDFDLGQVGGFEEAVDPTVLEDMTHLGFELARMYSLLDQENGPGLGEASGISVIYLGKGVAVETEQFGDESAEGQSLSAVGATSVSEEPREAEDSSWTAVRVETGNEFRVSVPRALLRQAGRRAEEHGLLLGSEAVDESGEVAPLSAASVWTGPVSPAWSNGQDNRVLKGTYNTPQTHLVFRKLVSLGASGGCSGTLIGPKHIITAAHCIRNYKNRSWRSGTAYAGRSGPNAWRARASFGTTSSTATWYWVPSQFLSIADGTKKMPFSATPYDIGVIVTHTSRLGDGLGWLGWYWWSSDAAFGNRVRYNRGYPGCGASNAPANCRDLGLYGDSHFCASGDYDSPDGDGINRRFRHHCDTSPGHSGSSLYHYLDGSIPVVTAIHSWAHCVTCSSSNNRPNTAVRITKEYSDVISWLRQTFP